MVIAMLAACGVFWEIESDAESVADLTIKVYGCDLKLGNILRNKASTLAVTL